MCVVCLEKEKKKNLLQQRYVCGVFREREKKKKSFTMELVQQYVCGVFREREKKIFCNGTCAAAFFIEYFNDHLYIRDFKKILGAQAIT
jgi:hypothetical protein